MWRYVRTLLIGSFAVAVASFAVQPSVSVYPRILFVAGNVVPLLFAYSLLLCLFLARSGNSAGLKWLALGFWIQTMIPGLSMLLTRFGLYPPSSFPYISWASSYFVVVVWLRVIVKGWQRPRASS
jgi:hypothetical protein